MLELNGINVTLGKGSNLETRVLNQMNFQVCKSEFVVVIGSNGAGKSTLLNVISGAVKTDCGTVILDGCDVTNLSPHRRAPLISQVMQDPGSGTIGDMTIFENMSFYYMRGRNRGFWPFATNERKKIFQAKLCQFNMGLEDNIDGLVSNLSGGQRQALSIIMAVLSDSKVLLLDEITSALDPVASAQVMNLVDMVSRNRTCVMITHNMSHAIKYGNRLVILKDGCCAREYNKADRQNMTASTLAAMFDE